MPTTATTSPAGAANAAIGAGELPRRQALLILAGIIAIAAAFRFYGLGWGAPFFHFHIDEHYVFIGADLMRRSMRAAAESDKFFMYSPLPMYLVNALRTGYELVAHPLNLTVPQDQTTYMVLGRAISATFGTATIPVVYAIGTRLSGRVAGLLSAAFLAVTVLHLRDSHFFSVDLSMVFFCALTWLFALRLAERGDLASAVLAGAGLGAAVLCKYSGAFMALPIGVAYLLSPRRPALRSPLAVWARWVATGALPLVVAVLTFAALNPLSWLYFDKFRDDIRTWVTNPLLGAWKPIWIAQFADVTSPTLYWFTNLMWWGVGPALEIWALAGLVWLATRRRALAAVSLAVPIGYYAAAGQTIAPMMRYLLPLTPALAVAAGVLSADWLRRPRLRLVAAVATVLVLGSSALYAGAVHERLSPAGQPPRGGTLHRARHPARRAGDGGTVAQHPADGRLPDERQFLRRLRPVGAIGRHATITSISFRSTPTSICTIRGTPTSKSGTISPAGSRKLSGSSWTIPTSSSTSTCRRRSTRWSSSTIATSSLAGSVSTSRERGGSIPRCSARPSTTTMRN